MATVNKYGEQSSQPQSIKSVMEASSSDDDIDIEKGPRECQCGGYSDGEEEEEEDGSLCYSDAEDQSLHSRHDSNCAASAYEDYVSPCASVCDCGHRDDESCVSLGSLDDVDLEAGVSEIKPSSSPEKPERNCRICHLGLENAAPETGGAIVLGCSCKDDLALSHRQCAETWFKIRGNKICEICGSTACNVVGSGEPEFMEQWNEASNTATTTTHAQPSETRRFWRGQQFLNFLLACMVIAFVISWLFHFNVPG